MHTTTLDDRIRDFGFSFFIIFSNQKKNTGSCLVRVTYKIFRGHGHSLIAVHQPLRTFLYVSPCCTPAREFPQ